MLQHLTGRFQGRRHSRPHVNRRSRLTTNFSDRRGQARTQYSGAPFFFPHHTGHPGNSAWWTQVACQKASLLLDSCSIPPSPERPVAMQVRPASPPRAARAALEKSRRPRRRRAPSSSRTRSVFALTRNACKFVPAAWRAAQTDAEDDDADAPDLLVRRAKKQRGNFQGKEWRQAHGDAWKKFLQEKLRKCECKNPRVSKSNRCNALKVKGTRCSVWRTVGRPS